eukprot:767437-Hanusia_phi.AAC.1
MSALLIELLQVLWPHCGNFCPVKSDRFNSLKFIDLFHAVTSQPLHDVRPLLSLANEAYCLRHVILGELVDTRVGYQGGARRTVPFLEDLAQVVRNLRQNVRLLQAAHLEHAQEGKRTMTLVRRGDRRILNLEEIESLGGRLGFAALQVVWEDFRLHQQVAACCLLFGL